MGFCERWNESFRCIKLTISEQLHCALFKKGSASCSQCLIVSNLQYCLQCDVCEAVWDHMRGTDIVNADVKQQGDEEGGEDGIEERETEGTEYSNHSMTLWLTTWVRRGMNTVTLQFPGKSVLL